VELQGMFNPMIRSWDYPENLSKNKSVEPRPSGSGVDTPFPADRLRTGQEITDADHSADTMAKVDLRQVNLLQADQSQVRQSGTCPATERFHSGNRNVAVICCSVLKEWIELSWTIVADAQNLPNFDHPDAAADRLHRRAEARDIGCSEAAARG